MNYVKTKTTNTSIRK